MRSFPAFHFDVTKMSLASRIEHEKLSFLRRSLGRNACGLQSFLSLSFVLFRFVFKYPRSKLLMTYCSVVEKKCKSKRKAVVCWDLPQPIFSA